MLIQTYFCSDEEDIEGSCSPYEGDQGTMSAHHSELVSILILVKVLLERLSIFSIPVIPLITYNPSVQFLNSFLFLNSFISSPLKVIICAW